MVSAMRRAFVLVCGGASLLVVFVVGCKRHTPDPSALTLAQVQERAALFEPKLARIKAIPVPPPPVTTQSIPLGATFALADRPGDNSPRPYLVVHVEDLAAAPKYYTAEGVKLRLNGSGTLSGCVSGLAESKDTTKKSFSQYTMMACTDFKYAFVVRTTEYVSPTYTGSEKEKAGNTTTITEHFTPGKVSGEISIYDLSDGHAAGGFRFHAESSAQPSVAGGFSGALDRDLSKNAQVAAEEAYLAATKGVPPSPSSSAKPTKKK